MISLVWQVTTIMASCTKMVSLDTIVPKHVTSPSLNYYRLARITMVEGTKQVCLTVLNQLPQGETLHTALVRCHKQLAQLREKRIISEKQWRLLYPHGRNADIARIDLTLWSVLLRNITKCRFRNVNWNEMPGPDQTEWYHDVLRVKETRNSLSHLLRPELDDESFRMLWNNITSAIRRLNP
jgi:DZIP3/ hRUL138-like HEPN